MKNKDWLILFFLSLVFLTTRLINLTKLPIFTDEAMYLNWGRLIVKNPKENLFISLTDGQQPFFIWLAGLVYLIGGKTPLLAGRLISVVSGLGTTLVLFFIGKELLGKKWNIILPALYIIVPFTLWHDRLAIKDSFLMFLASLLFYFSLKQARFSQMKWPIFADLTLGIALLTKSIAYFFIGLYIINIIIFTKNYSFSKLKQIILAFFIAFLIQGIAYLSPLKANIGPKHGVFLLSLVEFFQNPFLLVRNNLYSTVLWWWQYYSLLIAPAALGWLYLFLKNKKLWLLLSLWVALPIGFEIFMAKIYIPRYFLFTFIAFSILVGFGVKVFFTKIKSGFFFNRPRMTFCQPRRFLCLGFFSWSCIALMFPGLLLDYQILFDVENARLPQIERWQYLEGWPSGYGVKPLIDFFKKELKNNKVNVIAEEETLIPSSLSLYLSEEPNFKLTKAFKLDKDLYFPKNYLDEDSQNFIVLNHFKSLPDDWPVEKVPTLPRANGKSEILVYLVK